MTSVYLAYNAEGQLLYVGISLRPRMRLAEHVQQSEWWPQVQHIDVEHYDTRPLARARELHLIRTASPLFNKEGRVQMAVHLFDDLREIRHERQRLDREEAEIIALIRAKGYTWDQIGRELGVTKQAAWERYGKGVEEPHRPTS